MPSPRKTKKSAADAGGLFGSGLSPERHVYSVTEITRDIKGVLENTFGQVWVEGEVSNFKVAASGHFYFSLKDANAVLSCAMFTRANRDVAFKIEDGLKVVCFGSVAVYEPRGSYQLIVERVEPKGIGARQLALEQLKRKLQAEGLFLPERKKLLPAMPFTVGVVTSSAGAAVRDILQILGRGASCVDVVIRPVRVQGETAAGEIAAGVADLNAYGGVDVIIVSRGGGSVEDLWPFNEEAVARAIAASRIPTISAVGHQINTTIADLVADAFVETPSAAAKIIVDSRNSALGGIAGARSDMDFAVSDALHRARNILTGLRHMLKSPLDRLLEKEQLLDELRSGLHTAMRRQADFARERLRAGSQRLDALSPLKVLGRGYSLSSVYPDGAIIRRAADVRRGDMIRTLFAQGGVVSRVEEVMES